MLYHQLGVVALAGTAVLACAVVSDSAFLSEGQKYVETVVPAVTQSWNADEILTRADPRMLEVFPADRIREMTEQCSRKLGRVRSARTLLSSGGVVANADMIGKEASYVVRLDCEKGAADVTITVHKSVAGWKILGFYVKISADPSTGASRLIGS